MAGESRKWMILVATIWIQAFTGTNFDFSAYSSKMKSVIGISQIQLNYLAVASDLGKAFGWSSGLASISLPLWLVMFIAAFMGLFGYGIQWLVIRNVISLPYFVVFVSCLLGGCSICWFNTVCFILCNRNFPSNRPLAISLTVSFNGVSAAMYALAANAINPSSDSLYLLLNAVIPFITSILVVLPILRQPALNPLSQDQNRLDSIIFLILNFLAVITGLYLLFLTSTIASTARILFGGAIMLLVFPLGIPGIIYAREWFHSFLYSSFQLDESGFLLVDADDLELHKQINSDLGNGLDLQAPLLIVSEKNRDGWSCWKNRLVMLGEEHTAKMLVKKLDFWLYYIVYLFGGTMGLVYSNNLGQIAQSLGQGDNTSTLITLYSTFSFFGRLLSAAPDFLRVKVYFARTGWLAIALIPTPIAFFLLATASRTFGNSLQVSTAIIGLSSGFIFAAAVSVTSELFGPNSVGVNHNIMITNIPLGSLIFGYLAALVYDENANLEQVGGRDLVVCTGRNCYLLTFMVWGCVSTVGLVSSVVLFLRTRPAYDRFEKDRLATQFYD